MTYENLAQYGFAARFAREAAVYPGLFPARVTGQHRELYRLVSERGELSGAVSGALRHGADGGADFPAVGDWVMIGLVRQPGWLPNKSRKTLRVLLFSAEVVRKLKFPNNSILLAGGGMVIDTPGMRELRIFHGDLSRAFEDIAELAERCRFRDCTHTAEPGCAVRRAIETGELPAKRFENYRKLERETRYDGLNARQLENAKIDRMFGGKAAMKQFSRSVKKRRQGNEEW